MSSFLQSQNMLLQFTVEYLEHMRCFCKENGYDIQKLFEEDDPQKVGCVPDFVFLYIIYKKFSGQVGFSIEQVRLIGNYFRAPDGSICYMRLHFLMKSDENAVDQIRKATQIPYSAVGASTGSSSPTTVPATAFSFHPTNEPVSFKLGAVPVPPTAWSFLPTTSQVGPISAASFPSTQNSTYSSGGFFSSAPLQQQQPISLFGSTVSAKTKSNGLFGTYSQTKDASSGLFSNPASLSVSAPGFFSGSGSLPSGYQPSTGRIGAEKASIFDTTGAPMSNGSTFGSQFGQSFGSGGGGGAAGGGAFSTFGSSGSSISNSGNTNNFAQPASSSSGPAFGQSVFGFASSASANNVATSLPSGGSIFGVGFSTATDASKSTSTFVNSSTSGGPTDGSGFVFSRSLTSFSGDKSETAGPTLPAFTHGLSQQSTNTVTKILGSHQNQPSAQQSASESWSFGGTSSTATYSGGFDGSVVVRDISLNPALNGTTGFGADKVGSGDATSANGGVTTNPAIQGITKAGDAQTDPHGSEGLPKEESKQNS